MDGITVGWIIWTSFWFGVFVGAAWKGIYTKKTEDKTGV